MTPDVLCIGSVLWDVIGRAPGAVAPGADVPGRIAAMPGGVAFNVAAALARRGMRPALLSAVGRDGAGDALVEACGRSGVDPAWLHRPADRPTDRYMAIEAAGGLVAAIADTRTLEAAGAAILAPLEDGRLGSAAAPWAGPVVLDGNLTGDLIAAMAAAPAFAAADLRIAAASPAKAARLVPLLGHPRATVYVNRAEAGVLAGTRFGEAAEAALALVARGAARAVVTDGARRCADAAAGRGVITGLPPAVAVARVTGAGDIFMAAHLAAEHAGADPAAALAAALCGAADHVSTEHAS
ncbi:MAG: PfkB family carbohydrate kinase [Gemmobacter sp.]